jgi:hypothetical protein
LEFRRLLLDLRRDGTQFVKTMLRHEVPLLVASVNTRAA